MSNLFRENILNMKYWPAHPQWKIKDSTLLLKYRYSTGNERQTPTGGTISEQIYLGFTKNKHSTDVLSPRAIAHKLFSFQLLKRGPWKKVVHPPSTTFPPLSFDKEFHPLYIDFMLKYFQN